MTEEQKKELEMLVSSFEMLIRTKKESSSRGRKDASNLISNAIDDTLAQISKINPSKALELSEMLKNDIEDNVAVEYKFEFPSFEDKQVYYDEKKDEKVIDDSVSREEVMKEEPIGDYDFSLIESDVQFDVIPLPSKGQCYKKKNDRVPVAYLTAYDENLITSPNLYRDGLVIDLLLKQKVLDKSIALDELCCGDVDAITLFLRATSYGAEFPIVVLDPESGERIDVTVDLTELKMKSFTLKGDADGYFDFTLPVSKDVVKFKFLTRKDERLLNRLSKLENNGVKAMLIKDNVSYLKDVVNSSDDINSKSKQEYMNGLTKFDEYAKQLEMRDKIPYTKTITNRLELSIMAVNGNYDKAFISKYIKNMGAKDSLMLRRYMLENEPGIDFQITVERPQSLGGGSFTTFLDWDDSIFLNLA